MSKEQRIEQIARYAQSYYEGDPEISDGQFDEIIAEFRKDYPDYVFPVGWGYNSQKEIGEKAVHYVDEGSIDHRVKLEELEKRGKELHDHMIGSPKIDGSGATAYYIAGMLLKIIRRGTELPDGRVEGLDVTENLRHAVPNQLSAPLTIAVRGEIAISIKDLATINEKFDREYTSARNAATGISRATDENPEVIKYLRFPVYGIAGIKGLQPMAKPAQIDLLKNLGFEAVYYMHFTIDDFLQNMNEDWEKLNDKLFCSIRDDHRYLTDGMVLTHTTEFESRQLDNGWTEIINKDSAFKFMEDTADSRVLDIEWQHSRTGKWVPVLKIEPVELSGATISSVTANNIKWVRDWKCGIGSLITIIRSNEVIPKMVKVLEPSEKFNYPEECDVCGDPLVEEGVNLSCVNNDCPNKLYTVVYRIIEHFAPMGIASTAIDGLFEKYFITTIEDMKFFLGDKFPNTKKEITDSFGPSTAQSLIGMLEEFRKYSPTIAELLTFANIPSVGKTCTQKFMEEYTYEVPTGIGKDAVKDIRTHQITIKEFLEVIEKEQPAPEHWSGVFPNYLARKNFDEYRSRIVALLDLFGNKLIKPQKAEKSGIDIGWKICVTGKLHMTNHEGKKVARKEWSKKLEKYGVKSTSVKKGIKYLVTNTDDQSDKRKKADSLGIPTITEPDFYLALCSATGLELQEILETLKS